MKTCGFKSFLIAATLVLAAPAGAKASGEIAESPTVTQAGSSDVNGCAECRAKEMADMITKKSRDLVARMAEWAAGGKQGPPPEESAVSK